MKTLFCLGSAFLLALSVLADATGYVVSDVVATSRQPWEDAVDIAFTVTPPAGAAAKAVKLDIVASNGVDDVYISDASLPTRLVRSSGRQSILWRASVDHAGAVLGHLKFYISVKEEVPGIPPYLIIGMKDGAVMYADDSVTNVLKKAMFFKDYMAFRYIPPTTSEEWKAISGGSEYFTQGTPSTAEAHDAGYNFASDLDLIRELPHRIKLTKGFYLAVYPLVWGQLEQMGWPRLKIGPGDTKNMNYSAVVTGLSYEELRGGDTVGGYNFPTTTAVHPESLIGVIRARTGLAIDLPTEAQWEYAARAGSTNAYWFTENDVVPSEEELKKNTNYNETAPHMRPCNRWGLYGMIGCCHQWTTTLGRTTNDNNANGATDNNFWYPEDGAVDPLGPATTYAHGYRVTRGSHYRATGTTTGRDGKKPAIAFRVYRTGYRNPMKADSPSEGNLAGARLCLTLTNEDPE